MRKVLSAAVLFVLLAPAAALPQAKTSNGSVYEQLNLFGEAFQRIRQDAVEPVTDPRLVDTAIAGMLASLDPRSVYLTEAQYQALKSQTPQTGATPGLVLTIQNSQLTVVSPRAGSPAAAADVRPGDRIYAIDKVPTYDLTLPEVEQRLRGPAGTSVTLLMRHGSGAPKRVTVKRAPDHFATVTDRLEGSDIGYIRLAGFDDATPDALAAAVKSLREQAGNKLIGLILDLRNNPGGDFESAVKTADAFIDKGDIALVKGRKEGTVKHIAAHPGDIASGLPIVGLVNLGTAREAELVAGALQDDHRAVLLGTKTFGESGIETLIPLKGNGAIRLTTARYLTPDGHEIEGKGLTPDLTVSPVKLQVVSQVDRTREVDLPGALKNPQALPAKDKKTETKEKSGAAAAAPAGSKESQASVASSDIGTPKDEQLTEAMDVLRGLAVASGRTAAR